MILRDNLEKSLAIAIPTIATKDHNKSDLEKLMTSYQIIEQAKDSFLAQEISFEEYICLCEKHEVNVDSYMETIEHNLVHFNLM